MNTQVYKVRYVHKIAPREDDKGPDVALHSQDFSDARELGAALRRQGALARGARITAFRLETNPTRAVCFPRLPGSTTYWHAIVLEPIQ